MRVRIDRVLHAFDSIADGDHLDDDGVFSSERGDARDVEHRVASCAHERESNLRSHSGRNRIVCDGDQRRDCRAVGAMGHAGSRSVVVCDLFADGGNGGLFFDLRGDASPGDCRDGVGVLYRFQDCDVVCGVGGADGLVGVDRTVGVGNLCGGCVFDGEDCVLYGVPDAERSGGGDDAEWAVHADARALRTRCAARVDDANEGCRVVGVWCVADIVRLAIQGSQAECWGS